jgi:hypothetical protein
MDVTGVRTEVHNLAADRGVSSSTHKRRKNL